MVRRTIYWCGCILSHPLYHGNMYIRYNHNLPDTLQHPYSLFMPPALPRPRFYYYGGIIIILGFRPLVIWSIRRCRSYLILLLLRCLVFTLYLHSRQVNHGVAHYLLFMPLGMSKMFCISKDEFQYVIYDIKKPKIIYHVDILLSRNKPELSNSVTTSVT